MNSVAMTGLVGLCYEGLCGRTTGACTQCDIYAVSGVRVCVAAYDVSVGDPHPWQGERWP